MWYLYAILAAITWGLVYTIDQKILEKVAILPFMFFHAVLTIFIIGGILIYKKQEIISYISGDITDTLLLVFSILATILASYFIYLAIEKLGSSRAAIFEIIYPFFVVIFSLFLYKNTHINFYFILGSILLFLWSYIIIYYS